MKCTPHHRHHVIDTYSSSSYVASEEIYTLLLWPCTLGNYFFSLQEVSPLTTLMKPDQGHNSV